jgi:hypothetical protein
MIFILLLICSVRNQSLIIRTIIDSIQKLMVFWYSITSLFLTDDYSTFDPSMHKPSQLLHHPTAENL